MENKKTTSAHTPGPWHVELAPNWKPFITNEERKHVCTLYESKGSKTTAANANLIAAAPELLEAAKIAAEIQHEHHAHFGEVACTSSTPCVFCSTIAKAENAPHSEE